MPTNSEPATVLTCTEIVDQSRVTELLLSDWQIDGQVFDKELVTTLIDYLNQPTQTKNYKPKPGKETARVYCDGGFQFLWNPVRAYLCQDRHIDLDIVNCHPTIFQKMAEGLDLEVPLLKQYNKHPKKELKLELLEFINGKSKDQCKQLPDDLKNEIKAATIEILESKSEELASAKQNDMPNYKKMSYLLQVEERKIVDKVIKHLQFKKIEIVAYCFDGLILKKESVIDLEAINKLIKPYKMVVKPWSVPTLTTKTKINTFSFKDNIHFNQIQLMNNRTFSSMAELDTTLLPIILSSIRIVSSNYITKNQEPGDIDFYNKLPETILEIEVTPNAEAKPIKFKNLLKRYSYLITCTALDLFTNKNERTFTTWTGFASVQTDLEKPKAKKSLDKILEFIKEVIADNDEAVYNYILNWLAFVLQNPGEKTGVGLVIAGNEGAGKSVFLEFVYKYLFGASVSHIASGLNVLTRQFNKFLMGKVLVCLEELKNVSKDNWLVDLDSVKDKLTRETLEIEKKHQDPLLLKNAINLIAVTNNLNAIPMIEGIRRRFALFTISNKYQYNKENYFTNLSKHLNEFGANCLYTYLMNRNLKEFTATAIPETTYRKAQIWNWLKDLDKILLIIYAKRGDCYVSTSQVQEIAKDYGFNKIATEKGRLGFSIKTLLGKQDPSKRAYHLRSCDDFKITDDKVEAAKEFLLEFEEDPVDCLLDASYKDELVLSE